MRVTRIRTENRINPIGIDEKTPEFSWVIDGENVFQRDYRVTVATTEELLNSDNPDMWDSGSVKSDETFGIFYGGKPLKSCTRYYWKVCVNGIQSDTNWFETAFLNPEKEFNAFWIGQPLGFAGSVDDVRVDINVNKAVSRARFYVAALGTGRIYLNGKLISDTYFDGAVSVYDKSVYYRTYELDLKHGKNALCLRIGYGFYGAKKMYGKVCIEYADGTEEQIPTLSGRLWNVKRDAVVLNGVYDGETYDARAEEDWMNPDYTPSFGHWVAMFNADPPRGKFKANPVPAMKIVNTFAPASVTKKVGGGFLVHIGVNITGFLTITAKGKRGARYTVTHAEKLKEDGSPDNANFRAAENKDVYIFKGEGAETFTPEFTYHAFEYAFIDSDDSVEILDVKVNHIRSDLKESGEFKCSDDKFNLLHKMAVQTESNNLNGTFTDCPQRDERLGWLNDLTSRLYQSVCNFPLKEYLENFTGMITECQYDEGMIPDTVPFVLGSPTADFISAYTVTGALQHDWYGNKRVLRRNYVGFAKWIEFMRKDADAHDGVAQFSLYGDWCPARIYAVSDKMDTFSAHVKKEFMSAAYFLWYLKQMRVFAVALGKQDDESEYDRQFVYYKDKFDKKYYNEKTGLYGSGSQGECSVMMTVLCDDKKLCARLASVAADDIVKKGFHMTCGNQTYRHLIYNLCEYGYADVVEKMLINPEYPGYGFMLSKGATSVWERWEDAVGSDMHSFNHPMFTAYDGFFYHYILGIRPPECGSAFKRVVVQPYFSERLVYAEGGIDTLRGKIDVAWKKDGNAVAVKITTPPNTELLFKAQGKEIICGGSLARDEIKLTNGTFNITVKGI